MIKRIANYVELAGDSREIGYQQGAAMKDSMEMRGLHTKNSRHDEETVKRARETMDRWCPGVTEEIRGFSEAMGAKEEDLFFYFMTYLVPRCSQISLDSSVTESGNPLIARNYEFAADMEDFAVARTSVKGRHTHLGTTVLGMGRDEGINDQGLVVTMSSCGFPVGPLPGMRNPALEGLQFWAVTRALLENCSCADDVKQYVKGMPISFNLNLIATDKNNNRVLVETYDGRQCIRQAEPGESLWVTNHAVMPELIPLEPKVLHHSKVRYEQIERMLGERAVNQGTKCDVPVTKEELRALLMRLYPQGLYCPWYRDFFGTTKAMVFDPVRGTMELCWGGRRENGWEELSVHQPLESRQKIVELEDGKADASISRWVNR